MRISDWSSDVCSSDLTSVTMSQFKHAIVQRVEAGQRNELESVAHGPKFALSFRDRGVVQVFLPVERRRAVISQHLGGKMPMEGFRKLAGIVQNGVRRIAPKHIGIRGLTHTTPKSLAAAGPRAYKATPRACDGKGS